MSRLACCLSAVKIGIRDSSGLGRQDRCVGHMRFDWHDRPIRRVEHNTSNRQTPNNSDNPQSLPAWSRTNVSDEALESSRQQSGGRLLSEFLSDLERA